MDLQDVTLSIAAARSNEAIELRQLESRSETRPDEDTRSNQDSVQEQSTETEPEIEYPKGAPLYAVMVACALALVIIGLDLSVISTAVPSITNEFKTIDDIGWYYSAFRLTLCSFQFMFGKMYTVFPIKWVFMTEIAIFELALVLCATAATSKALVLGRALAGFGSAGIISGIFMFVFSYFQTLRSIAISDLGRSMITQTVPLNRRPIYGAFAGGIECIFSILGPLIGGAIVEKISWRWCFWINLPIGGLTLLLIAIFFKNPRENQDLTLPLTEKFKRLNLLSTAVFVPSSVVLLLALQWGGTTYSWTDARIIVLFVLFVTLLSVFAWIQWRDPEHATLPPRIVMQRSIAAGALFSCCNGALLGVTEYYLPVYLQSVKQYSAAQSGLLVLPCAVGLGLSLVCAGPLTSAVGYYAPFMIATSILTPVAGGLMTTLRVDASLAKLIMYQGLLGAASGIGYQAPQVAAQTVLMPKDVPIGLSIILFAQNFGPAVFVPVAQTIFTGRLKTELRRYAPQLNATALQNLGLADLKSQIPADSLQGALLGYDHAITQTYFLPLGLGLVTIIGTLAMEWKSVKQKTT